MEPYKTLFTGIEYTIIATKWMQRNLSDKEKSDITWSIIVDKKQTLLKDKGVSFKYKFSKEYQGKRVSFKANREGQDPVYVRVYVAAGDIAVVWEDCKNNKPVTEVPYGSKVHCKLLFKKTFLDVAYFSVYLENENGDVKSLVFGNEIGIKIIKGETGVLIDVEEAWRDGPKESLYNLRLVVEMDDQLGRPIKLKEELLVKDFFVDDNGLLINPRVEHTITPSIYSVTKFNSRDDVNAIVLHRTASKNAAIAYNTAIGQKQGGHFTVEGGKGEKTNILSGIDGAIYQFGSLKRSVSHAGKIRSRPEDLDPKKRKTWTYGDKYHEAEIKKKYPDRFPYNADSIGIEVVGECLKVFDGGWSATWEDLTQSQTVNVAWLVLGLLEYFSLDKEVDLYTHEQIRSKAWDEGGVVLRAIKPYLK